MSSEKVLLVVVHHKTKSDWSPEEVSHELKELVETCGGEVVEKIVSKVEKLSPSCLIGSGKIKEIAEFCCGENIDTVIFSHDLKGNQQRNIEDIVKVKTIDRTQLILDIFARHARSLEGKMQVELAQLQYLLPRLVGKGIALSRLGGGIGTLGPGETKLEVDRRRIGQRIDKLKKDLKDVEENRTLKRKKRQNQGVPLVSLVGYTNAGKSTLLNKMTDSEQVTRDGLFTTLDSLSRQYSLPNNQKIVISDTVGFMHDLPHHLIESFKATLEEVRQSDLLLHVLDISKHNFRDLHGSVLSVLKNLDSLDKPVITVLNKIDNLDDKTWFQELQDVVKNPVAVSAVTGENLDILSKKIEDMLSSLIVSISVIIPINRMDLVNIAHQEGQVVSVKYYNDRIHLRASLPRNIAGLFEKAKI